MSAESMSATSVWSEGISGGSGVNFQYTWDSTALGEKNCERGNPYPEKNILQV